MENKKLDSINHLSDFVNLFMAIYSIDPNVRDANDNVMLNKNFKVLLEIILNVYSNSPKRIEGKYLYEDDSISVDDFINKFKVSSIKEFWQEKFIYDFDQDCIITSIKKSDARNEIDKYDGKIIRKMEKLVDHYQCLANYPNVDGELNLDPEMYANLKSICETYENNNGYVYRYKKEEKIS